MPLEIKLRQDQPANRGDFGGDVEPAQQQDDDPLRQLEQWGRETERRVRRGRARQRLLRILTWPLRPVLRPRDMAIIVAIAAVAVVVWVNRDSLLDRARGGPADDTSGYPTQAAPSGIAASSKASAAPAGPFVGTPAARWAAGATGITLPTATAVKGFTKAQVAADLATVKKAMVAGRLDRRMLVDHDMSAFLKVAAPGTHGYLNEGYRDHKLLSLVTLVAEGTQLSDLEPRVKGRFTVRSVMDGDRPVLEVVSNFVWVYAFVDGQVSLIHDQVHWRFYRPGDVRDADLGLRPYRYRAYWSNIDCDAADRGTLAPPTIVSVSGPMPTEDPANFYDPDHSLEIPDTC